MLLCLIDFYKFTYILHIMQQAGKKRLSADSLFPVCILYPGYQKRHDMHREHSPLCQAEDAVLVDSSDMTIDEVVERITSLCR